MKYVLGLDQGASKTHAIVADERGNILGMGKGAGACHSNTGLDNAVAAVLEAADEALIKSGLERKDIHTIVGGLTGVDWAGEAGLLENAIGEYFPQADIKVVNDCIIAMKSDAKKENCGILCAGSGLNCAVQKGKECFVYGFYIPDEYQGGASLGKRTLQAVFDAQMGIVEKTVLTEKLLAYFHEDSVDKLLYRHVTGGFDEKDYLSLPIPLEEAALEGDKVASGIWESYGKHIVVFLTARMRLMGILNDEADIVLSGSIFKCKYERFGQVVKEEIKKQAPKANIIDARYEPVIGAMLMAIEKMNGHIETDVYKNLAEMSEKFPIVRMRS